MKEHLDLAPPLTSQQIEHCLCKFVMQCAFFVGKVSMVTQQKINKRVVV